MIFSNVTKAFTLHIKPVIGSPFIFYTMDVEVSYSDRIQDIKNKINDKVSTYPYDMELIHAGKMLENGRTLSDYGITHGATVYIALRIYRSNNLS